MVRKGFVYTIAVDIYS